MRIVFGIRRTLSAIALASALAARLSQAQVTFSGIAGADNATFSSFSQNGFVINATSGIWQQSTSGLGNPAPAIYGSSTESLLEIRRADNGLFNFLGVQLRPITDKVRFSVRYFNDGVSLGPAVFSDFTAIGIFYGVSAQFPNLNIDRLELAFTRFAPSGVAGGTGVYYVDNIDLRTVSTVPEPSTFAMLGASLGGLLLLRRRRR